MKKKTKYEINVHWNRNVLSLEMRKIDLGTCTNIRERPQQFGIEYRKPKGSKI